MRNGEESLEEPDVAVKVLYHPRREGAMKDAKKPKKRAGGPAKANGGNGEALRAELEAALDARRHLRCR